MDKKSLIFIVVSFVIFALMLYFVGLDKVISALKRANLYLIGLAIIIQIFTYFLYTCRWHLVNKSANLDVSFKNLFPVTMVGLAMNNITPSGRGGGEPIRAYILAKEYNYRLKDTFATVVADRFLDTFPFVILAVITIISMIFYFNIAAWLIVVMIISVIAIILLLAVLIYMCINENFGLKVENGIINLVRKFKKSDSGSTEYKVHDLISGFQENMKMLISDKKLLSISIPLSFLVWFFEILRVYVVFLAFGTTVSPIIIAEVFIIASLVGMIPLLPGGLGAVDGIMMVFYSKAGIALSLTAPITLIERTISFWMATIIGLMLVPYYGSSILDKLSLGSSAKDLDEEEI